MYKSEMQLPRGTPIKDPMSPFGSLLQRLGFHLPHHDIQFRASTGKRLKLPIFAQPPVQLQGRCPASPETAGKLSFRH